MSDCSSEDSDPFVFYRDRPDWSDVTPIPQDDGPHPIVRIAYSERFQDVYDYFRAILKSDEKSERALELTKDAASLNSANYTVWYYRRLILKHLNKDLREELAYISSMIEDFPKNYQVWHHRKVMVEWLKDPSQELEFVEKMLHIDAKNYHAWQHRQWVLREFGLWEKELDYVNKLLVEDLRNNSAWNQRYFVISNTEKFTKTVKEREIEFTKGMISKAPNNESAWNYLRGILLDDNLADYPEVFKFCQSMYDRTIRSPYLLAFMVDIHDESMEMYRNDSSRVQHHLEEATKLCKQLADEFDPIRQHYWSYIQRSMALKYGIKVDGATESKAPQELSVNS